MRVVPCASAPRSLFISRTRMWVSCQPRPKQAPRHYGCVIGVPLMRASMGCVRGLRQKLTPGERPMVGVSVPLPLPPPSRWARHQGTPDAAYGCFKLCMPKHAAKMPQGSSKWMEHATLGPPLFPCAISHPATPAFPLFACASPLNPSQIATTKASLYNMPPIDIYG
jgi:hypothetical protein